MSLNFATQLTAVATAMLAVFAIITAVYAVRAFRKQSQEVSDQASMLKVQSEQRKLNERQTEVLALQAAELRESLGERKREALERRSAQASRVSLAVKMLGTGRTAGDDRNSFQLEATVVNASDQQQPIYDVSLYWYCGPEGYGTPNPEPLGTLLNWEKEIRQRDYLPGAAPEDCGAVLTFRDAAGVRWIRMPDGALSEQSSTTARESIQAALEHHLPTGYNRLDNTIASSVADAIVIYPHSRGELSLPGMYSNPPPPTYAHAVSATASRIPSVRVLRAATGGSRKAPRYVGFTGCRWLPVWFPGGGPLLRHISGSQFCLVSAYPPVHPQGDVSG